MSAVQHVFPGPCSFMLEFRINSSSLWGENCALELMRCFHVLIYGHSEKRDLRATAGRQKASLGKTGPWPSPKRAAVWYRSNCREIGHWKQRERNYVLQVWAKQVIVLPCRWSSQGKFIANEQALPPYPASPPPSQLLAPTAKPWRHLEMATDTVLS